MRSGVVDRWRHGAQKFATGKWLKVEGRVESCGLAWRVAACSVRLHESDLRASDGEPRFTI
jgi:hypothetical protein